jgi:hypothetical protein
MRGASRSDRAASFAFTLFGGAHRPSFGRQPPALLTPDLFGEMLAIAIVGFF